MARARKKKKERGRPMTVKYPPRIDTTPEKLAQAMFRAGSATGPVSGKVYHCADCGREVNYPDILYRDGCCEDCHKARVDESE